MTTSEDPRLGRLDPRDRAYAEELDVEEREIVVVFVYIAEAHAVDEWQMQANVDEGVTLEDRFAAAREGVRRLRPTMPVLVDGIDDPVSHAFAAWPERLYVAERGGRLAHVGGPGPFELDPDAAGRALAALVR